MLAPEATMAKRKDIAATIRQDAAKLKDPAKPLAELMRLMESLEYEKDDAALQQVEQMTAQYLADLKKLPADKVGGKKDEAKGLADAFKFLVRFKVLPDTFAPKVALDTFIKEQGWDKKK
jgi:seryl-tRNA synthetase